MVRGMRVRFAVVAAAIAVAVLPLPASVVEQWYSRLLYPRLQAGATSVSNLVPVAMLDVLIAAVTVWVVARFVTQVVKGRARTGLARALFGFGVWAATLCATLYLVFVVMWGLNYRRVPLR